MLAPGTRIGSFEILAPLGAGGMGEVYRARDTRLGREVAIKLLPAERLADDGRRKRFEQEARAASALNHPHIVTIHEIESADGVDFIVMEYLPGQSLAALIPKNGMPVRDALKVAIPIADALTAAHARGIVHRDVKPANVMVTRDGLVKVLDFGLAKLVSDDPGDPTGTYDTLSFPERLTEPGAITGTAAYMSPEQATGGTVDARSDIFSFGVLLYQLVTGRRPFQGSSVSELRASVVRDQPRPPRELVPGIPEALERLILRCLRKEPDRRVQHMGDVKLELQELVEGSESSASTLAGAAAGTGRSRRWWLASGAAGLAVLAVTATLWLSRPTELPAPSVTQLSSERWAGGGSFSPDGAQIAYASAGDEGVNWDIWLKIVGEPQARRLTTDPAAESQPAWSPDGTEIAFLRLRPGSRRGVISSLVSAGETYVVSPLGGPPRRLSDLPARGRPSWSPDGRWLAVSRGRSGSEPPGGIYLISAVSGESRPLTFPKAPAFDLHPAFAPGGRAIAYAACAGPEESPSCDVHVVSLDAALTPVGPARALTRPGVSSHGLAWTRDGSSIVYSASVALWRVRADGTGAPERLDLAAPGAIAPATVGTRDRLAFVQLTGDVDVHRVEPGRPPRPLAQSTLLERQPSFSPDGRRIAFQASGLRGHDIWLSDADGSNPTRLTRGVGSSPSWSPDGRSIAFDSRGDDAQRDVWTISVDGSGLRRVTSSAANDIAPSWSRDGRFIYFASDRTGRSEVHRVPASGGPEKQVTRGGGIYPVESFDGRTLYYQRNVDGALLAQPSAGGDGRELRPCVRSGSWNAAPHGLVYQDCDAAGTENEPGVRLRSWDARNGVDTALITADADGIQGLSVSPDGRSIVYGRVREISNLMMIENFR